MTLKDICRGDGTGGQGKEKLNRQEIMKDGRRAFKSRKEEGIWGGGKGEGDAIIGGENCQGKKKKGQGRARIKRSEKALSWVG